MTAQKDPGSYTVQDEPFDTFGATKVPLRTPHGPLTLTLTDAGHIMVDAGYVTTDYQHPANYTEGEWFSWDSIEIAGSAHFYAGDGWAHRPSLAHLYSRGGSVTPRRKAGVLAYWGEIVRRYAAEHPHVLAHAGLRDAVSSLASVSQDIAKAEEELRALRAKRTRAKQAVRANLAAEHRTRQDGSPDCPRPYHRESVSGYVAELENDRAFMASVTTREDPS